MPDDRRPSRSGLDPELREALELLATVSASVSDRVDGQTDALDRMAKALAETRTAAFAARKQTDPALHADRVAAQVEGRLGDTLRALRQSAGSLGGHTDRAGRAFQDLQDHVVGAKHAAAREAWEAREWRRQRRRLALWAAPALLALLLLTALLAPRAMAAHETLCSLAGATWWQDDATTRTACTFFTRE